MAKDPKLKQIVFCEPNKDMFKMCCDALLVYSTASGLNAALSHTSGEADLVVPAGASTLGSLNPENLAVAATRSRVRCVTGDALIEQGLPTPDVIKIDTEGHELSVLSGLAKAIRKHQPVIFLEHRNLSEADIFRLLPSTYEVFSITSPSGFLVRGFNRNLSHNSAFIPRDRIPPIYLVDTDGENLR
jgi:FkbM family methyltransferase